MKIFFSAGEPSGDLHAANLIREIRGRRPDCECVGFGGSEMRDAGCEIVFELTTLAVMGLLRVLWMIPKFWRVYQIAKRYFAEQRPDALVLVDFPGFHWWVAAAAKRQGIPVFYYCPPQIWAWGTWRIGRMQRLVDHVLCTLPFEHKWYQQTGLNTTFVGHPFFDEVCRHRYDMEFLRKVGAGPTVGILPGSRRHEVGQNLKWFLHAAQIIHRQVPGVRFQLASFNEEQADMARERVEESGLPIDIHVGKTLEIIRGCDCCLSVSGSVSLELLYHTTPTVILYRISHWGWVLQSIFRRVKYITLVNLMAAQELFPRDLSVYRDDQPDAHAVPFPEYLRIYDPSPQMAAHIVNWLKNPIARQQKIDQLEGLKAEVAQPGASRHAAEYVLRVLDGKSAQRQAA